MEVTGKKNIGRGRVLFLIMDIPNGLLTSGSPNFRLAYLGSHKIHGLPGLDSKADDLYSNDNRNPLVPCVEFHNLGSVQIRFGF